MTPPCDLCGQEIPDAERLVVQMTCGSRKARMHQRCLPAFVACYEPCGDAAVVGEARGPVHTHCAACRDALGQEQYVTLETPRARSAVHARCVRLAVVP